MLRQILDSNDMFEHQSCLQHLLKPIRYTELDYYQVECAGVFRSSWQLGRTCQKVINDDYFMTLDLCGEPIPLKNFDRKQRGTQASPHHGIISTRKKRPQSFQLPLYGRMNPEIKPNHHNIYADEDVLGNCTRSCKFQPSGSQL